MVPTIAQPLIEQATFDGWAPDPDDTFQDPSLLKDVSNLLPDLGESSALVTRLGYSVFKDLAVSGHYIKHIWHFQLSGVGYLMCVVAKDAAEANNVQVWAVTIESVPVATRVDTSGVTWANPDKNHWGMSIQHVFYGGSPGNEVYSWDGTTWDATANMGTFDTLVDNITPGAGELARDFAFKSKQRVTFNGDVFTPVHGIRYDKWVDTSHYTIGQRVSLKVSIGGYTYWRSYRCILNHDPTLASTEPGVGSDWKLYWQKVRLPLPQNEDSETSDKWYFVPIAPGSSVAQWHADRFWIRYDGQGDKSRLLYSAPIKPEKHEDVPDVVFDMTDFRPGNDNEGPGGGWLPFNDGAQEGVIEALWSYGPYLLVFKRQSTWTLTGFSEENFNVRRLSRHVGAVGPQCVVELDGLVYFLSDDGLYVTDGTAVEEVQGLGRVRSTLTARIDSMHAEGAAGNRRDPQMWVMDGQIWIALPVAGAVLTLVYDVGGQSFWKTNLPAQAAHMARAEGIPALYFAAPSSTEIRKYGTNKDGASTEIAWTLRTTWWPFGVLRQERRIRRVWAVVKGVMTFTLSAFREWDESTAVTATRVVAGSNPTHIEGKWLADTRAIQLVLSSTKAPARVYGLAVHTEPRRIRYHN